MYFLLKFSRFLEQRKFSYSLLPLKEVKIMRTSFSVSNKFLNMETGVIADVIKIFDAIWRIVWESLSPCLTEFIINYVLKVRKRMRQAKKKLDYNLPTSIFAIKYICNSKKEFNKNNFVDGNTRARLHFKSLTVNLRLFIDVLQFTRML